ncbi:hypothetical protein FGSG_07979 [Fusarium graminearum PH-1]|uniref:Chromosome 2, complete genome n=1 Tax=Gibberella zeae (strain ATCC MYA-4620 / CBS 123657 / FGSC 9075 / NRRL 31084 / PH-1) TaxID=229533 RepID=I1RUS5_GIBZE|nr:hypothetical protein FGSG_07979 [Fusarium graminearum PH-1]ESU15436.1 hypothetical protein FGSG_07979 [Fusarium graminearum PH-1]EYB29846.1 hypothetical protein FG05_07979 [Fusarium graminearum]CEF76208.1 unnamed protein product [Fusarium graminearum]|eukprot:XP_011320861.1 hypothetical protein FGSG_07979 [Fusarium graminearum PH-1]
MIPQTRLMESQIFDWYSSLPLMFYFGTPQGYVAGFATDAMVYVLRHRYISFCELVSRPFVRLCVDRLVKEIDSSLHTTITSYASQVSTPGYLVWCSSGDERFSNSYSSRQSATPGTGGSDSPYCEKFNSAGDLERWSKAWYIEHVSNPNLGLCLGLKSPSSTENLRNIRGAFQKTTDL